MRSKRVILTILATVTGLTVALTGCTQTPAATHSPKPTTSHVAKPTHSSAPIITPAEKTVAGPLKTADGTYSRCSRWQAPNATTTSNMYVQNSQCLIYAGDTTYPVPGYLVCEPKANGDAALGIVFKDNTSYTCLYTIPVPVN
jgi:hypothetical protein